MTKAACGICFLTNSGGIPRGAGPAACMFATTSGFTGPFTASGGFTVFGRGSTGISNGKCAIIFAGSGGSGTGPTAMGCAGNSMMGRGTPVTVRHVATHVSTPASNMAGVATACDNSGRLARTMGRTVGSTESGIGRVALDECTVMGLAGGTGIVRA